MIQELVRAQARRKLIRTSKARIELVTGLSDALILVEHDLGGHFCHRKFLLLIGRLNSVKGSTHSAVATYSRKDGERFLGPLCLPRNSLIFWTF